MEIQSKTIEKELFTCPYCKTEYSSKKSAENCMKWYEHIKYIKENCKPFRWYPLAWTSYYFGDGKTKKWYFIKSIYVDNKYCSNKIDKCTNLDFHLKAFGTVEHFYSEKVKFFPYESLSITEYYEKFGKLPEIESDNSEWEHIPYEIITEFNKTLIKAREDLKIKYDSMDKSDLVDFLLKKSNIYSKLDCYEGERDESFKNSSGRDTVDVLLGNLHSVNADEILDTLAQRLLDESRKS